MHVTHDQLNGLGLQQGEGLAHGLRDEHLEAVAGQNVPNRPGNPFIIVNNEDRAQSWPPWQRGCELKYRQTTR